MGRIEDLREEIWKIALVLCEGLGIELVELTVRDFNETLRIELLADLPGGAISFEECSRLNRSLDNQLYEVLKLGDNYTLEVSSPGLDRPLTIVPDFRRAVGRRVRLFLKERIHGKIEMDAVIKGLQGSEIVFETKFGELLIGIEKIERARQIIS